MFVGLWEGETDGICVPVGLPEGKADGATVLVGADKGSAEGKFDGTSDCVNAGV